MKWRSFLVQGAVLAVLAATVVHVGAAPGPIRVSENGQYFVDSDGAPFYFLADTQWELFRRYSLDDARLILENRKTKGFTVVMVMLTGVGNGTGPNLEGQHPWLDHNPATPNPAYFDHVDAVLKLAQANDIHLLIGLYHQTYGDRMTVENAKPWAAWVTRRYHEFPNILWTLYPKAKNSYRPIISKLAEGIHEGDRGQHLVSVHPDPSPASSSFLHAEPWLGFNSIQVWNELGAIYPMTLADYTRTPAKPATMLEGVYEGGEEYGYPITPLLVRREAYYTCFAGGFHGYGHNDSWRVKPTWRSALDDPGAHQMTVLKRIFNNLPEWWALVPDQAVLTSGGNTNGDKLNLAARSATGQWIMAYIAAEPAITLNMAAITAAGSAFATWINPVAGNQQRVGTFPASGTQTFTRPADWQDAVLVVKTVTPVNLADKSELPNGSGLAAAFPGDAGLKGDAQVIFADDFESGNLGEGWDETGNKNGKVLRFAVPEAGMGLGNRCLRVEAHLRQDTGGGLTKWFEPADAVFIRFYTRFDPGCDYVHHFVTLRANKGLRGGDKWSGFGGAGLRPEGSERFSTAIEPWGNWGRWTAPGRWNFYSYWHEMEPSKDGKYWGNSFAVSTAPLIPRDRWMCVEFMLKHNTPGLPDGEQAFWIDGTLQGHWKGINWRKTKQLEANALTLESYVTDLWTKNPVNVVFFDNVVIARRYIGAIAKP